MGNDCSLLRTCLENTADKVGRIVSDESPIYYEQNAADAEKRRMPLRKREQSYSEPVLETYEKQLQQVVTGVPQEFLKLYEFGKLLGVGTTSKVYQIYHKRRKYIGHRKPFACKVIDKRKLTLGMVEEDVEPLLQQLRKEVDILRRINHPHIVAFQDFVETKRLLFIVTEYLPGGELFDYILKHGPLPEDLACTSLFGIFSAVAYLHDRGVIHRDIKAENVIFFHKVNGEVSLKLIDFGFSTILKHDLTGSFLGTGGYIAPEIRQNKQYSTSVDNWALGVLLYCTMSAKLPFSISLEALPADRTECSSHFKLRFPAKQWCGVSDLCKDLIRQLLNVDPFTRLTAKESLNHPWFRPARHQKTLEAKKSPTAASTACTTPRSLEEELHGAVPNNERNILSPSRMYRVEKQSSDHEDDGQTESEDSETGSVNNRVRGKLLRSLHSELRPVQSLIQLERKNRSRNDLLSPTSSTMARQGDVASAPRIDEKRNSSSNLADCSNQDDGYIIGDVSTGAMEEQQPSETNGVSSKVPTLWDGIPPAFTSLPSSHTELLKDSATPQSEDSVSVKTPRDLIHSKHVQDQTKLPSIHFVSHIQHLHGDGDHKRPKRAAVAHEEQKENSSLPPDDGDIDTKDRGTRLTSRYPLSAHDLESLPHTFWRQAIHRDTSFVAEEMHDNMAGALFYYTYIPMNSTLR